MTDLLLSIIIPMYNAGGYIQSCIDSIADYSGNEIEIIVVDDGSKDDSLAKVAALKDERIKLFTQINKGPSTARNKGIKNAQGTFVMFVDADDWLEKGSVDKILAYLKNTTADTLIFKAFIFCKTHKAKISMSLPARYTPNERLELEKTLLNSFNLSSVWAKAYNMKIIRENNLLFQEDVRYYEDTLFNIKYFYFSQYGCFINEYIYNYRDNRSSLSHIFSFSQLDSLIYIYNTRLFYYENCFMKNYPLKAAFKKYIDNDTIRCLFLSLIAAKRNKIKNSEITKYIQTNEDINSLLTNKSYLNLGTKIRAALINNHYYSVLPLYLFVASIIQLKYLMRSHSK